MVNEKIKKHAIAAKKLNLIKDNAFKLIRKNIGRITEYEVHEFIISEFKRQGLVTDRRNPIQIVAVNQNAAIPHYFPASLKSDLIKKNNLILIDIWARLNKDNSPFADITWIGYSGRKVPKDIKDTFKKVLGARDRALDFIRKELKERRLPRAREMDEAARDYFKGFDLDRFFIHKTGHSLGTVNCHGKSFNLSRTSRKRLKLNVLFTIEPGLYFNNKFGIRSEIDCYITNNYKLVVTTKIQKEIIKI